MNSYYRLIICIALLISNSNFAQHSVARDWNEEVLNAIRFDFARPTVHARNLFHTSSLMYDAWAIFDGQAETVFLGKTFDGFVFDFNGIDAPTDIDAARHEIISYAIFNLLQHRFQNSPHYLTEIYPSILTLFRNYGYDVDFISTDYSSGSYAALGNYMANQMIAFGLQDGSNEIDQYSNINYIPSNEPLILNLYEDNSGINPNVWQPLAFDVFIDQSGNTSASSIPDFLSPEWGKVSPFCLKDEDLNIYDDPGYDCYVYKDPGPPVLIENSNEDGIDDPYKWHFALVAAWSSHLDPNDETMIDISPGSIGNYNSDDFPQTFEEYKTFYNFEDGGDASNGHDLNPYTGEAYEEQFVKRADYARVLAEFWADGPDSETPPGHWFTILNYVNDNPLTIKKMNGSGPILPDLEWDVKSYLTLGGAMHDSAVATWGIKGYYDYIRPISAIRYMASKGQSSNANLPSYDPHGLPLIPNFIELIESGEPLAGVGDQFVGEIKIRAWRGPDFIGNPETGIAEVDWIYGQNWWPYQRGTFVTPPFAAYVSGHSTFSRAAAEVLTLLTGDAFFPGGMGVFDIEQNNFLVFEMGPTQDMTLQWATYRDASDQTSLSRIWGGIHPPIDDIRGRLIGEEIGIESFNLATEYFGSLLDVNKDNDLENYIEIFPIPVNDILYINNSLNKTLELALFSLDGKQIYDKTLFNSSHEIDMSAFSSGLYFVKILIQNSEEVLIKKLIKN